MNNDEERLQSPDRNLCVLTAAVAVAFQAARPLLRGTDARQPRPAAAAATELNVAGCPSRYNILRLYIICLYGNETRTNAERVGNLDSVGQAIAPAFLMDSRFFLSFTFLFLARNDLFPCAPFLYDIIITFL